MRICFNCINCSVFVRTTEGDQQNICEDLSSDISLHINSFTKVSGRSTDTV